MARAPLKLPSLGRRCLPLAVLAALVWIAAGSAGAAVRSTKTVPDVTVLFNRALERVRQADHGTFARAVVLEAEGFTHGAHCTNASCTSGRPAGGASGVTAWEFIFQNGTPKSPYHSVVVTYGPSPRGFGRVIGKVQPFLEDVTIRRAPTMTLADAISRLRQAGYRRQFVSVTLRNPLGPTKNNPEYIFGFANHPFVAVDTQTGKVRSLG